MATSISKLAVIISGHTKPLEDAMKKAQSKVGSFGSSIKSSIGHGFGAGLGAMGLDKMEAAMKKAIADVPHLSEAAERAEKSFGKILLNVTGVSYILPKVASLLSDVADWMDGITPEMKKQQELQANMLKAERQLADARIEGLDALLKSLDAQMDALNPMREQLRIAEQLKPENDPYLSKNISLEQMSKPGYDPFAREKAEAVQGMIKENGELVKKRDALKEIVASAMKLRDEGAKVTEEQMDIFEKVAAEKTRLTKLLFMGGLDKESYNRAMQQQEDLIMATSEMPDFGDEEKPYQMKLSGAATAGSQAAYSIIANAQANMADKQVRELQTHTKLIIQTKTVLDDISKNTAKPGSFAANVSVMKL